jgi:ATP synthase protein I
MTEPRKPERRQTGGTTPLTSDLEARIARARAERDVAEKAAEAPAKDMSGWNRGLRLGSEFVAAILVGAGIGWLLDTWLHTSPWLMLVMLIVGFAAGVLNVVRSANEMNKAAPPPTADMRVPDDEEEDD